MTTHSQRRPRRPAKRPTRKATPGTNLAIAAVTLLAVGVLFQAAPQIATVLVVAGGLAYIAASRKPRTRALPDGHRSLTRFQQMTPTGFEHAIRDLALEDKHHVRHAEVVGGANDRGADVLVTLHDRRRILIQCKRYKGAVGSEHVQIVNGTYRDVHHCDQAVIVTTSGFTKSAVETNALLPRPLHLIGGGGLVAWANGGRPPWN